MGNNHDKYFGKDKRNVLILGLPESGKTSMLQLIVQGKQANLKVQKTKDLNIRDAKLDNLTVTFFDLAGGERQRIFWKQHYDGTQGIIFLVDCSASQEIIQQSLSQFVKLSKADLIPGIPIAICLNKCDLINENQANTLQKKVLQYLKNLKVNSKIFLTSLKTPAKIKQMVVWLLKQTKPL